MLKNKMRILFTLLFGSSILISGCTSNSDTAIKKQEEIIIDLVSYKDSDYYTSWQDDPFTSIKLEGQTATVDGPDGAIVGGNQILIRTSGTYVLSGTLDDGQIVVDSEDHGNVRLVLNGATIDSSTSAPIYIKQADKTIISLEEGTENILSDATEYVYEKNDKDEPSATIYSKDDLTINGTGSLVVNGNYNDAVKSNDDLLITGGTFKVTSKDDGMIGRDVLAIKDATITVKAGGDGLKASNVEDKAKGNIVLESGTYTIVSDGDGIQAEKNVVVTDGMYSITAGGGSPETIMNVEFPMGDGMRPEMPAYFNPPDNKNGEMPQPPTPPTEGSPQSGAQPGPPPQPGDSSDNQSSQGTSNDQSSPSKQARPTERTESNASTDDTISAKGIKAGTTITITGGNLKIDSLEDAVHSNQDVLISGGITKISTGDDGIHSDQNVVLNGGELSIDKSLEGIEGTNITVADGNYHVIAEDDGININGGSDEFGMPAGFGNMNPPVATDTQEKQDTTVSTESENQAETTDEGILLIKGGYLFVNANGDGLDSNTSIKMTGGTVIVYGPTNNGNAALDYNNSFDIEGGILVASGSSGMAQGSSDGSSQNAIMMTYSEFQKSYTTVFVEDENGNTVLAIAPEKQFQSIVISTPDIELNQNYTIHTGGTLTGDNVDGYYQKANYEKGTLSTSFSLSSIMTYLNEDGVTEGNPHGMMGGFRDRGGMNPFGSEQNNEQPLQIKEE
ncbi:carbohydrate-binding domain-containing protein [Ferdinandcohnia sp. SAFN-114]|uniref:carbohydrate-binding domain-containing protein n=1 Tax=Ferdinandcohnia sp. SAFN-114 TaxID=3387275 RepID=UPI003F7D2C24